MVADLNSRFEGMDEVKVSKIGRSRSRSPYHSKRHNSISSSPPRRKRHDSRSLSPRPSSDSHSYYKSKKYQSRRSRSKSNDRRRRKSRSNDRYHR